MVDRSGSMGGSKLMLNEALILLLKSMPAEEPRQKFHIISFGSDYEYLKQEDRDTFEANDEDIQYCVLFEKCQ